MLAEKNEYLQEAAQSVYMANAEEIVRQKCRAREDAAVKAELSAMATRIAELEAQLAQKK